MYQRKINHLETALLNESLSSQTNGFEKFKFEYQALPEINFDDIDTSTEFLNKQLSIPVIISAITGGIKEAEEINKIFATFAQNYSIGMCVGSQRIGIENSNFRFGFNIRKYAPDILLFANIGAVQLNYGYGIDQCKIAVEMINADALCLHLNPMQEVFQNNGNVNFENLLGKIENVAKNINVPIIIKEVGYGISENIAKKLYDAGVFAIDIAGSGGTDWVKVESLMSHNEMLKNVAKTFSEFGIQTADSLNDIHQKFPDIKLIASGGIKNGLEIAKSIALGASLCGIARNFLMNIKRLDEFYLELLKGLQIAMFGIGAKNLKELSNTKFLKKINE